MLKSPFLSRRPKDFRILLFYPNLHMSALMPQSIGIFTSLLKEEGYVLDLFDCTFYQDINAIDPTGAGDSYAGGFSGYLAENGKENLIDGAIHGTAAASLTVSGVGVDELLNADRKTIDERFDIIKYKMEISAQ